jgi:16S rRNA (adenine1518-N6/adenine1519-N6)-dimethyltransferase
MNPKLLLDRFELFPKKSLGQNFLHDPNALEKIAAAAEIAPDDTVLEIGAGMGALTMALAKYARRVIAVEIDERLAPILEAHVSPFDNVELIYDDILALDIATAVGGGDFLVVANVPYYITSAIIRHLLELPRRPRRIVMTVQLEVAQRLTAKPGQPDMSLLSVSAQYYTRPQVVTRFKPAVFYPRPEVDSAVVRLDTYDAPPVDVPDDASFFAVARAGFSQKRKQLKNALGDGLAIGAEAAEALCAQASIDGRRRAETLSLVEWAALARCYAPLRDHAAAIRNAEPDSGV